MNSPITVNELNFKRQCSDAWNMLTKEQQSKYHCLIEFVDAYAKLTHEDFDYDAMSRITDFVAAHDQKAYDRWVEYQKQLGNR